MILPLLESSLYQVMAGCCQGKSFWDIGISWRSGFVSNVILSHQDYPSSNLSSPVPITLPNISNTTATTTVKTYWSNVSIKDNTPIWLNIVNQNIAIMERYLIDDIQLTVIYQLISRLL